MLTFEFKKYRKIGVPRKRFQLEIDMSPFRGNEKLLEELEPGEKIKPAFPPLWVDSYDKIIEDFSKLQESLTSLESLQKKQISNPFSKDGSIDSKISLSSSSVLSMIKAIDSQIKDLRAHEGNSEDKEIRGNIIKSLSGKLREFSLRYKKKYDHYMEKVKSFKPNDLLEYENQEISLDGEDVEQFQVAKYKNEAINSLVQNIIDLADIFKELNSLVVIQGTILDRVDYNIQKTLENTNEANKQLIKAEKHQKCSRAAGCIALLVGMILLLVLVLGLKVFI